MSSATSLAFAGLGAVTAAVGGGMLLARCFRAPRPDLIAWSVALLGLLVSLGAQLLGYLSGYDPAMFRAMAIGGLVIAPLACILGLTEIASRGLAARFCARVYIAALAIVAVVILAVDPLGSTTFTKSWPNPHTYYQSPPNYMLYAISVVTVVITLIAAGVVMARSGSRDWSRASTPQVASGVAALMLAYPGLALLARYEAKQSVTLTSVFTPLLAIAVVVIVWSGRKLSQQDVGALHGRAGRGGAGRERDFDRYPAGHAGDVDRFDDGGAYGSLYRPDRVPEEARLGGPDPARDSYEYGRRERDGYGDDWRRDGVADGERGRYDGGYETGDLDLRAAPGAPDPHPLDPHPLDPHPLDPLGTDQRILDRPAAETARKDLFGQIAIYTLLEDRVHEFDQLTEQVVDDVRSREPDTLVFIVHAVPSAPMQRILYEVYKDRAAYERHQQQPYVIRFESDRMPYVLATNVIELGLQQAKVSPFPSVAELFGEPGYDTSGFERPDYLRDYGRQQPSHGDPRGSGGRW